MKEINNNFLFFVKHVWKDFIEGSHHKKISEKFNLLYIFCLLIINEYID